MRKFIILSMVIVISGSCKKQEIALVPSVTLNVANVSGNVSNALVRTPFGRNWSDLIGVYQGTSRVFTILAGSSEITVNSQTDTAKELYTTNVNALGGSIYSLFFAGNMGNDVLLVKDTIITYMDSSFGVRFVNFSIYSGSISTNISGSSAKEVSGLAYKGISSFKKYPGNGDYFTNGYQFEFRNAVTDSLVASCFVTPPIFNNVTLVLYSPNGSHSVMTMNNY